MAIKRVAFLLFIHEVTYSNLDLDTSYPQAVHQSSRQIPGYHLKLGLTASFLILPNSLFTII